MTTEETEERDRIVCILATETPAVDSVEVQCVDCGATLWRSVRSLSQDLDPMCKKCVPDGVNPKAAVAQIKEMAEATGVDALALANYFSSLGIEIV